MKDNVFGHSLQFLAQKAGAFAAGSKHLLQFPMINISTQYVSRLKLIAVDCSVRLLDGNLSPCGRVINHSIAFTVPTRYNRFVGNIKSDTEIVIAGDALPATIHPHRLILPGDFMEALNSYVIVELDFAVQDIFCLLYLNFVYEEF